MFYRWGLFAYKHRRVVPIVVVAFIVLLFALAGTQLGERMSQEGWDDPNSSSTQAAVVEQEIYGRDNQGDVILLVTAPEGKTVDDPTLYKSMAAEVEKLKANPEVETVTSYFTTLNPNLATKDKSIAFVAIGLAGDGEQTLKDFRAIADQLPTEVAGADVQVAGATSVADALDKGMSSDISRAEVVALPAVGVLLLIVFGSVVAASMPLLVGILSIMGSLGILSLIATVAQVNVFAQSVVTLLGLGLAIDYGLFLVSRFREEMADSVGHDEDRIEHAVGITVSTAGKTVVFSAAMVAVALSGLFIFPQAFLKSVAYGAISAVGLAAVLSITVLPSIFGMLGKNIDKWSIRKTKDSTTHWSQTFWARIPTWAMKHSKLVTVAIVAVLLGLTLPLGGIKFGGINETYLPPNNSVRAAQEEFDETFSMRTDPVKLVVENATPQQLADVFVQANKVEGLTGRFGAKPTVDKTTVLTAGIADRKDNAYVVDQLRNIDVPEGVTVHIGGTPALEVESIEALLGKLPWMALYIVAATFILLSLIFGSVILPAKAVIMNILGLGATLGILTLMFVDGFGAGLLGYTPGPLMSPVLVLIVAIVYGLSTDYEVFLLSRMVEARENGSDTDTSIRYGTAHTGFIITAAAVIMIVVCGAFGFSEIVMMKYIAFGMIAALFLDATIIRMLLVPAVMHMLRDDCWWAPRWVKKASAALGHNSSADGPPTQQLNVADLIARLENE